jgi:hypothetical protein
MYSTPERLSRRLWKLFRERFDELDLLQSLAGRPVKQDCVAFGFPNRREFDRPRAVQTKQDSARLIPTEQQTLRHPKRTDYELMLIAEGLINEISQVVQVLYILGSRHHCGVNLLAGHGR